MISGMNNRAAGFEAGKFAFIGVMILPVGLAFCSLVLTGCNRLSGVVGDLGVREVQARTTEPDMGAFLTYQDALIGKDADAVVKVFGKPQGVFEKRHGTIWMYSRWCVRFDDKDRVVALERDIAATARGSGAASPSMALDSGSVAPARLPVAISGGVARISNGGQPVDLKSLLPVGKVTVVDFYADWCGPCRKIGPSLEKIASENPDVVLVKVDIVKWGTPVTRQYNIKSVPNIRVFDRNGRQIGEPTHRLSAVQSCIEQAGS